MDFIKTTDSKTGEEVQISYKDYGKGRPVVLIHGWPLSKEMWEYQIDDLVGAGLRVIFQMKIHSPLKEWRTIRMRHWKTPGVKNKNIF